MRRFFRVICSKILNQNEHTLAFHIWSQPKTVYQWTRHGDTVFGLLSSAEQIMDQNDSVVEVFNSVDSALKALLVANPPRNKDRPLVQWRITAYRIANSAQAHIETMNHLATVTLPLRDLRPIWAADVNVEVLERELRRGNRFLTPEQVAAIVSTPPEDTKAMRAKTMSERVLKRLQRKGSLHPIEFQSFKPSSARPIRRGTQTFPLVQKPPEDQREKERAATAAKINLGALAGSQKLPVSFLPFKLRLKMRQTVDYSLARRFVAARLFAESIIYNKW